MAKRAAGEQEPEEGKDHDPLPPCSLVTVSIAPDAPSTRSSSWLMNSARFSPAGIAGKHQSMLDVIAPFAILPDNCFIMKKELRPLPFFGWFAWKTGMIAVDRSAHSKALKDMVKQARTRFAQGRQILIFPEGTRTPMGAAPDYKPGIAALYRDLECPCTPMATNSGVHWPAHGFRRYPGTVVYEFLPAIPAGLKRAEFMAALEARIEGASGAMLASDQ